MCCHLHKCTVALAFGLLHNGSRVWSIAADLLNGCQLSNASSRVVLQVHFVCSCRWTTDAAAPAAAPHSSTAPSSRRCRCRCSRRHGTVSSSRRSSVRSRRRCCNCTCRRRRPPASRPPWTTCPCPATAARCGKRHAKVFLFVLIPAPMQLRQRAASNYVGRARGSRLPVAAVSHIVSRRPLGTNQPVVAKRGSIGGKLWRQVSMNLPAPQDSGCGV